MKEETIMGKTIFIDMGKGGVGKTITAASLGVGLAPLKFA
jgi:septum formation inhibitor-activating ATPase MinD